MRYFCTHRVPTNRVWMTSVPRPQPPTDLSAGRRFSQRQEGILNGLEEIFFREGFRRLTIQQLAARLRCSRRTLYDLAPSKDELVLLVIDRLLQRIGRQATAQARMNDDPLARLRAYMSTASAALSPGTQAFSVDVAATPGAHRLFQAHYWFATSVCAGLIQDGIDCGVFRQMDARLAAELLYAGLDRLQDPEVIRVTRHTNAEAIRQVFDVVLFGLSLTDRPPPASTG